MTPRQRAKLEEKFAEFRCAWSSQGLGAAILTLARAVWQWLYFRGDCFLYARSLEEQLLTPEVASNVVIREANVGDLGLFESVKKASDVLWYKTLLDRGRSCIVALKNGQLVAHGWFTATVDPAIEHTYVPLAQDEIFIFDLFTVPNMRHQGIQRILLNHMFQIAQQKGHKRVLSLVMVDNAPSLKLHDRLGFRVISRFTKIQFLRIAGFYFRPNLFGRAGNVIKRL